MSFEEFKEKLMNIVKVLGIVAGIVFVIYELFFSKG